MSKSFLQLFNEAKKAETWTNVDVPDEPPNVTASSVVTRPQTTKPLLQKYVFRWTTPQGEVKHVTVMAATPQEARQMALQDMKQVQFNNKTKANPVGEPVYQKDSTGQPKLDKAGRPLHAFDPKVDPVQGLSFWKRAWNKVTGKDKPPTEMMKVDSPEKVDYILQTLRSKVKLKFNDIDVYDMNQVLKALVRPKKTLTNDQLKRLINVVKEFQKNPKTRFYFGGEEDSRPIEKDNGMLVQKLVEKGWLKWTPAGNFVTKYPDDERFS